MSVPPSNMGWPSGYIPTASEWAQSQSSKVDYPAPIDQGGTGGSDKPSANSALLQRVLVGASPQSIATLTRYFVPSLAGAHTLLLPDITTLSDGDWIDVIDADGNASTNNITVTAVTGQVIRYNGSTATTKVISTSGSQTTLVVESGQWNMVSSLSTVSGTAASVNVQDESVFVSTASTLNFKGGGVTATDAGGGVVDVEVPAAVTTVAVKQSGSLIVNADTLNFTGTGVSVTNTGAGVAQVSIPGYNTTWTRTSFTATAGQTTFTVNYTVGYLQVFLNGAMLATSDYTATNGTSVVLSVAAVAGDVVDVIAVGSAALDYFVSLSTSPQYNPSLVDPSGKVINWITNGMIGGLGLSRTLRDKLSTQLQSDGHTVFTTQVPSRGNRTLYTDGRTLVNWRRKKGKIQAGLASVIRLGILGHSWHDYNPVPWAIVNSVYGYLGLTSPSAGTGWAPVYYTWFFGWSLLNPTLAMSSSGTWTQTGYPGGAASPSQYKPPYGAGPDMKSVYSTGTGWYQWSNIQGNKITCYYGDYTGTMTFIVDGTPTIPDGGSSATVVCGNTGTHQKVTFTLAGSGTATHTFRVDLTGNTGVAVLYGNIAENTSITSGVLVLRMANSGMRALEYNQWVNQADRDYWVTELALDVGIVACTVNDYQVNNQTPMNYLDNGLKAIMSVVQGGKILMVEPQCGVTGKPIPQSAYADQAIQTALANGWEWVNLFDSWTTYTVENAAGSWYNTLHIAYSDTNAGSLVDVNGSSRRYANEVCNNLLFR